MIVLIISKCLRRVHGFGEAWDFFITPWIHEFDPITKFGFGVKKSRGYEFKIVDEMGRMAPLK
jgi:hypothetical protein